MILLASKNGSVGMAAGMAVLQAGGTALSAVEAATRPVEANPDDHSVGYGGYPNLLGAVELDAGIMDGQTLRTGAVAALRGYRHPITVARQVLEHMPHVLLAGDGAAQFAATLGLPREETLSPEAAAVWERGLRERLPAVMEQPPAERTALLLRQGKHLPIDPELVAGTVNVLAQDAAGRLAVAVSTSGWAWKYPGRVGDSPVVGAGYYADDRYGAAACTGWGELALRAGLARLIVWHMRHGANAQTACHAAFADLPAFGGTARERVMSAIALAPDGTHYALSTLAGRSYVYQTADMATWGQAERGAWVAPTVN